MPLPERSLDPKDAEDWIRDCLRIDSAGVEITVSGTCMEPALIEGSKISLRSPLGPPRIGDVVLLRTPAGLRLHRVLIRFRDAIRTKGDQGRYLDPLASSSAVIAVWNSGESFPRRALNTVRSLSRLLARPWVGAHTRVDGDGEHARFLP